METNETPTTGFGTTAEEWDLLRLAYDIAVVLASGETPAEETLIRFRALDGQQQVMFSSWWYSRPTF